MRDRAGTGGAGTPRRFRQVDVFTDQPLLGNPVAVVLDAEGLSDDQMAALARWTNLSETTFVLPATAAGADYRLRIFTPGQELSFAGHPTIGSAHAVLEAGLVEPASRLVQECGAGLVALAAADDGSITFEAPESSIGDSPASDAELAAILGGVDVVDARVIDLGPRWLTARLADGRTLDDIAVDHVALAELSWRSAITGLNVYLVDADGAVEVRSFAPGDGVYEDPVCGSGNAAVGVHVGEFGLAHRTGARFRATQGRFVQRDGRIDVTLADAATGARVKVGGRAVTVIEGTIRL